MIFEIQVHMARVVAMARLIQAFDMNKAAFDLSPNPRLMFCILVFDGLFTFPSKWYLTVLARIMLVLQIGGFARFCTFAVHFMVQCAQPSRINTQWRESFELGLHPDWYVSARWPIRDAKGAKKVKISCSPKTADNFLLHHQLCILVSQNQQISYLVTHFSDWLIDWETRPLSWCVSVRQLLAP